RYAPTIVSKNRYAGGMLAQNIEADLIVMDDGMQNYSLSKDITFCVVDGIMGFGNGAVVPQGPLRQPLEDGYALSDAFIIIGEDEQNLGAKLPADKPVFQATLKVKSHFNLSKQQPYIAFCGIGFPQKFETSLKKEGLNIVDFKSFGDHHGYTPKDIVDLGNLASAKSARLITTEKDYARLPDFFRNQFVDVLPVEIVFENPDAVSDFIKEKLTS
ncbi:MAG: tetraacyldisaccharide 4'-kinase, partial [Micavibrio aeruginosavorus]